MGRPLSWMAAEGRKLFLLIKEEAEIIWSGVPCSSDSEKSFHKLFCESKNYSYKPFSPVWNQGSLKVNNPLMFRTMLTDLVEVPEKKTFKQRMDRAYMWLFGFSYTDYSEYGISFHWISELVMILIRWKLRVQTKWYCFKINVVIFPLRVTKKFVTWYERVAAKPYMDRIEKRQKSR